MVHIAVVVACVLSLSSLSFSSLPFVRLLLIPCFVYVYLRMKVFKWMVVVVVVEFLFSRWCFFAGDAAVAAASAYI